MNLQIIYTQINRQPNNTPNLHHHYFNTRPGNYFYPASTVKLPVVLLALQKLNELRDKNIDRNTTMLTETAFSGQTAIYNDPTCADGKPTIANYIKKMAINNISHQDGGKKYICWTPELRASVKKIREAIFSPLQIKSIQTHLAQNFGRDGLPKNPDSQKP